MNIKTFIIACSLKHWELEKGIKVKPRKRTGVYTEKQFKNLIKTSNIIVKTEKGLEYLKSM